MIKVYQTIECKNNVITTIAFKGVKVKVEFTGGNVMKNIPARLYTKDPFVQMALDESDQKGRMYRFVQELPEGDDGKTIAAVVQQPTQQPAPKGPADVEGEASVDGAGESKMEFDNLAEAITYIASTWGEQVENESQARKFIEEKTGVKPVIHKG